MSYLVTQPPVLETAAANVAEIQSVIAAANAAVAGRTTNVLAAAADEVSAAIAKLFAGYGEEYQAVVRQATAFHQQFTQALTSAGLAYAQTELANALTTASGAVAARATQAAAPLLQVMSDPATTWSIVLGASGYPIPAPDYIDDLAALFISPWRTIGSNLQGLNTPEGLYPLTGIKDLTLNDSVARGLTILDNTIRPLLSDLQTVNILGYSQSSVISSLEMHLLNPANIPMPSLGDLSFTLLGNPANPNGGLLSRFPGLSLPSLGIDFGIATPDNSFPTRIYTIEYDGFGGFPQYPINFLADLNAFMGILTLHGTYPLLTADQVANAIQLTNTLGPVQTEYFMIPTAHLPLLDPVRAIPVIGNPIANLVEPDLRVLVNLGYGNTAHGWSPDPPNVATGFGVIPPVHPGDVVAALAAGSQQGIAAFSADLANNVLPAFANLPNTLPAAVNSALQHAGTGGAAMLAGIQSSLSSPQSFIQSLLAANLKLAYTSSNIAATAYAAVLPTADVLNAAVTAIPAYDVYLFGNGLLQAFNGDPVGGLINAFGGPVAANVGLATLLAGFELRVIQHAAQSISSELSGLL
ncbi:PE-PPE domain-containing protein [Mycobacterium sp. 1423905.2]|uniref:PE family protein n=1 Tax=Mycobacterium sp. 1423905.2 TaxID=1856859 RepID=UPI000801DDD5|nr:PE-PPE domain-containing protein [Mycobacterium sp. 1423905.2]OBJ47834.1 hypothetical protein A9W95_06015 [Mycobacterium sp. 1423905.2]